MSRDDSGFAGNEFDSYMGAPPARAGASVHAAAPEPAAVAPAAPKGAGSKKKRMVAILGVGVMACIGVVVFMKPKEAPPASAEVAAIMASAQSVDAAKTAMNAPEPAPAGAVMLGAQPVAPIQPNAAVQAPAPTPTHAAAAELQAATAAAVSDARPAAVAPVAPPAAQPQPVAPAPASPEKVEAAPAAVAAVHKPEAVEAPGADEALIKKLRADIAAERAARLRAERRAEAMKGATVAAVLSDGVVVRDAKGQERVIAVGDKVAL